MYVYSTGGEPVGFVFETYIYDMDGTPLGRIVGCRVHRFDGTYVGEWFRDMVVRRRRAASHHPRCGNPGEPATSQCSSQSARSGRLRLFRRLSAAASARGFSIFQRSR
jgi:hypothetical protein